MSNIEITTLAKKSSDFAISNGNKICSSFDKNYSLLSLWLGHFASIYEADNMPILRQGILSSMRESIACSALGLVRPSLMAMRLSIDLVLAWIFYKDHPVEWRNVNETGNGFKLKQDILKYLSDNRDKFKNRIGILDQIYTREIVDPYRMISAHLHGQSQNLIPQNTCLADAISNQRKAFECSMLAYDTSEYLSDILISSDFWSIRSLPSQIQDSLTKRFKTKSQQAAFFAE